MKLEWTGAVETNRVSLLRMIELDRSVGLVGKMNTGTYFYMLYPTRSQVPTTTRIDPYLTRQEAMDALETLVTVLHVGGAYDED